MAHLLVGSEGTLAYSRRLHLNLSPLPKHKTLGVCHFPTFYQAMEAPQHIVKLEPAAVELVDRTMIGLARGNPAFRATVDQFVKGDPDAILLVEFAGDDRDEQLRAPEAAGRADGRPRLARAAWSRSPTRRCSATSGKCARRGSTS